MQTRKPEPQALAAIWTNYFDLYDSNMPEASNMCSILFLVLKVLKGRNVVAMGVSPWSACVKFRRAGLSLLEVVLALSILAVAAALLAQVTKQATDNGMMSQRLSTAQILCESKMSEVLAGAIPLTSSSWTQITDSGRRGSWYYKIQTSTAERPNMIGVRLSVTDQPDSTTYNPELFFIVRWMIDPSLGLDTPPTSTTGTSSGGGSSGSAGGVQ